MLQNALIRLPGASLTLMKRVGSKSLWGLLRPEGRRKRSNVPMFLQTTWGHFVDNSREWPVKV